MECLENIFLKLRYVMTAKKSLKQTEQSDFYLDARGLLCPLPVLRAQKLLEDMPYGNRLTVDSTDAYALQDFDLFCRQTGHALVDRRQKRGIFTVTVEKRAANT